jgi:hypothetical protein
MSHHPPVFTHAADPLEAEDWLKTVLKMLTTCQCDDREKFLYAAGRLQGSESTWWDAYTTAHAAPNTITWDEFYTNFRSHHIPPGVMMIKNKEFLSLKQGGMSVAKYRDKFTELSRYATEEVAEDRKKQELFLGGLAGSLQYQLMSYPFPNFQQLVDAAIRLDTNARSSGSRRGRPPGLDSSGVRLARASTHRRIPCSALGDRVDTSGSSNPHVLLRSSSSLLSSFSVLFLRLHAQLPSRVSRGL